MKKIQCLLFYMLMLLSVPAFSAVAVDAVSSNSTTGNTTSLTVSHTTGAGSGRFMLVGVSIWNDDYETVSTVSYGSTSLSKIGHHQRDDDSRVEIWKLVAPASGTANVVVTFNTTLRSSRGAIVGVTTFTGVDQTTPHDSFDTADGDSDLARIYVTSSSSDMAYAVVAAEQQTGSLYTSPTITERWNQKPSGGSSRVAGAGATRDGASSAQLRWQLNNSNDWAVAGVSINPSGDDSGGSGGCVTFRDEFSSTSYNRNDGTANWATDWDEVGDNDWVTSGEIRISNNRLQLDGDGSASNSLGGPYLQREADLSSYTTATFSFDYYETGSWEGNDYIDVYVSSNGGSSWTKIQTYQNDQGSSTQSFSQDISSYIGSNTRIAFVERASASDEIFYIDNVQIEACTGGGGAPAARAEWRFDQMSWDGTADEVIDSSGNDYHGEAVNSTTTTDNSSGKVCEGGDFSASSTTDYVTLDHNAVDGLTDFTVMAWAKTSSTSDQTIISGNRSGRDNAFLMFFNSGMDRANVYIDGSRESFNIGSVADGSYHHYTWTRSGSTHCFYLDGISQGCQSGSSNTVNIDSGGLVVGQEQDSVGGGFTSSQDWDGVIDEVRVYSSALSAAEISAAKDETRTCGSIPIAEWRFDEVSWGNVVDNSGNNYTGVANNGATTDDTDPAISGSTGTCGYGVFDGNDDYISFSTLPNLTGSFTITAWIKPDVIGKDQRIFVDDRNNNSGFAFSLGDGGNGRLRLFSRSVSPVSLDSSTAVTLSTWQHVAVVHDVTAQTRKIFVNGSQVASGSYSGTWGSDSGVAAVGGELDGSSEGSSNFRFDGFIDEVRIYDSALGAAAITNVMNETHTCPQATSPVAYFELDEFTLDGTSGEVADNVGTSTTARAVGSSGSNVAPNSDGKVCYGVDIADNNDASTYAIDTGLDVNSDIGNKGSVTFWYRSVNAWVGGGERILFDASTSAGKFFYLYVKNDGKLRFGLEDANDMDMIMETPVNSINANTWAHIAITWDTTTRTYTAYIDGTATTLTMVEQQTSNQSNNIGELGDLLFGDTQSTYYYGGTNDSGHGRFDEIRIYNQVINSSQVTSDMNATHSCDTPPTTGEVAFAFNCVYSGLDAVSGKLYTRVAGSAFDFDVIALEDANTDNVADGVETNYAQDADRNVTVELVDTSAGGSCAAYPSLSPAVSQVLTFTAADAGRKSSANMTVSRAYRSIGCRVTDANDSPSVSGCSTDSFAIRPSAFVLSTPALNNSGSSGNPKAKAGDSFSLEVTTVAGYDGTPVIGSNPIEAHAGGTAGTLSGSFSSAASATGTASGTAFTYSEVGNFRFVADAIRDTGFTSVDQTSDCIDGSYSNSLSGGKVGCDFSNSSATAWVGRFTPDHFVLTVDENGVLSDTCSGFSYAGTNIPFSTNPSVTITAQNSSNATTTNYQSAYAKLVLSDINMPVLAEDATQLGVDGTNKVSLSWNTGSPSLVSNNDGTFTFALTGDTFTYGRGGNDLVAPFNADIDLVIQSVSDSDSVTATDTPKTVSPATVEIRHGRLNLVNAYGSELQTLPMTQRVEYYNGTGSGYVPNTNDSCTAVSNVVITEADASDSLGVSETCIWDSAGDSGSYSCATPGDAGDQYSQLPVVSNYNLNLKGPGSGNTGVLNVTADAPAHLEFNWLGAGNADPTATASFGIHNRDNRMIFMKEVR